MMILIVFTLTIYNILGPNPIAVVSGNSMLPNLNDNDLLLVQSKYKFQDIIPGDIIIAKYQNKSIVHRVTAILYDDPKVVLLKGDNNAYSIPYIDYPIIEQDYKGKVVFKVHGLGVLVDILQPPINYIVIFFIMVLLALHYRSYVDRIIQNRSITK